jgi:hypothetical protein
VPGLNGDGRPESGGSEGSSCYGSTTGFQLLGRQADGSWRRITGDIGMPEFLKTRGVGGWPDISIGGRGFFFPVQRMAGNASSIARNTKAAPATPAE